MERKLDISVISPVFNELENLKICRICNCGYEFNKYELGTNYC